VLIYLNISSLSINYVELYFYFYIENNLEDASSTDNEKKKKWKFYLDKIDEALKNYVPCEITNCSCYFS
jgi:hypothetical protein